MKASLCLALGMVLGCSGNEGGAVDAGRPLRVDAGVVRVDAGDSTDAGNLGDAGASDSGTDAGHFVVDAGPIFDGTCPRVPTWNQVPNAAFDCAMPLLWRALSGARQIVTEADGGRSLEATAGSDGQAALGFDDVVADANGATYCARFWARGTSPEFRFEIRESPSGLGAAFSGPLASDVWLRVPPVGAIKFAAQRENALSLLVRAQNGLAGAKIAIDDVDLWPSPGGACDEH